MVHLKISLPDPLGDYVHAQIDDGRSATVEEYVRTLIQADREEQERIGRLANDPDVALLVQEGLASGNAGPMTDEDWENLKRPYQVSADQSPHAES